MGVVAAPTAAGVEYLATGLVARIALAAGSTRTPLARLAVGQRRSRPQRTVQHRPARAACGQPGSRPAGDVATGAPPAAQRAIERQRSRAARRVSRARRIRRRGTRRHARGRMAARQLPPGRSADPRDPRGPAAGLLSPAAQAGQRPLRGLSACLRPCLGLHRAHRQSLRDGVAAQVRPRLPGGAAADDRRVVGHRDHAAHRAGGEPATCRPPHRGPQRGPQVRRRTGGPPARAGRSRRRAGRTAGRIRRRCQSVAVVHRATRAAPARPGSAGDAVARVAGVPRREVRHHGRGHRAGGAPAPGRLERDGAQHHHQHASDFRARLVRVLRGRQPGRRTAEDGERFRADGLRHAQPVSHRHRGPGARVTAHRDRDRASGTAGGARGARALDARAGPGLQPRGGRTLRVRDADRLPAAAVAHRRTLDRAARREPLRRRHRHLRAQRSRTGLAGAARRGAVRRTAHRAGTAGIPARPRDRRRVHQSHGQPGVRRADPAGPRPARGRAAAIADAGRRADAADLGRDDRSGDRPPGDPLPGVTGGRAALCHALRLGRLGHGAPGGRCGAARSRDTRHRSPQSAPRSGTRRRPLPAAASAPALERD